MRQPTASALQRVAECPASAVLPQVGSSSEDSARGNVIHKFLEDAANMGREKALALVPSQYRDVCEVIDFERLLPLGTFAAEVTFAYDSATLTAREVGRGLARDYSAVIPTEVAGTADVVAIAGDAVLVWDYKTGHGALPPAEKNWQLRALALMACRAYGKQRAQVEVVRIDESGGVWFDSATFDAFDLDAIEGELQTLLAVVIAERQRKARGEALTYSQGAHCRYCPAFQHCEANTKLLREVAADPQSIERLLDGALTLDTAAKAYRKIHAVRAILGKVESAIYAFAAQQPIPLGDGVMLGEVETTRESLDGAKAREVIAGLYGSKAAEASTKVTVTKKALEGALKAVATERKGKVAPLKREALAAIEAAGGIARKTTKTVKEYTPGEEQAEE